MSSDPKHSIWSLRGIAERMNKAIANKTEDKYKYKPQLQIQIPPPTNEQDESLQEVVVEKMEKDPWEGRTLFQEMDKSKENSAFKPFYRTL